MDKHIYIILTIVLLLCIPCYVYADYDAIINSSSVRIRTNPGTDNEAIATLSKGTNITVIDKTLYEGSGCDAKWLQITYKEKNGYVCSQYITFVDNSFNGMNIADWTSRVSGNDIAVRKTPSDKGTLIERLSLGTNVNILETNGNFYKISYYNNSIGYINKNYVISKSDITLTDEEYSATLLEEGFPSDYIPYLTYLHSKHPNWIFKAGKTNLNFSTSVDSELGVCYMQTTNDNYRTSNIPVEAKTWFKVNTGVIAFYMDPRNWLNEQRIFMFEKLDYESSFEEVYPTLIKSIFGSGTLSDDKYTIPIFNAGKSNKISPVHIASRIRLEVGANGSDSTNGNEFTWKGKTYSGYYNFFNIGAYEVTIDGVKYSAITRGLAYAAKLIDRSGSIWDNIETAITEGSSFLANGYITKGQGTLYYQKFNVGPNAYYKKYTHQYMTNIQAPATEGNQSYNSYKDSDVLDQTFIFEIPVFNNMPLYTSLPRSGDTNNDLSSIYVDGYDLSPSFDEDILEYEVLVPLELDKINITATKVSNNATISGTGEYELTDTETDITITVTSEVQEEKKYIITIKKVETTLSIDDIINVSNLSKVDNVITKIKNGTTAKTLIDLLITSGASKAIIYDLNNKEIKDDDIICTNYKIEISSTNDTKAYIISVKGDTSGDGKITILDLLQTQKHLTNDKKLTGASWLSADTSSDNDVTILDLLQIQKHITGAKSL